MRDAINRIHSGATPAAVLAALSSALLLAACGGSSPQPATTAGAASVSTSSSASAGRGTATATGSAGSAGRARSHRTPARTTRHGGATKSGSSSPGSFGSGPLAFAKCMRANGVPSFPDPSSGRGVFSIPNGVGGTPAFRAAQAKCQKLMGGGLPLPGSTTHPSSQTLTKLVGIARCMRQHGVPQFPDPRTSVPANPTGIQEITDFDGAILLFPATLDVQAPAYRHALTACGAPPLGLPH